jgi:hypothetical protein
LGTKGLARPPVTATTAAAAPRVTQTWETIEAISAWGESSRRAAVTAPWITSATPTSAATASRGHGSPDQARSATVTSTYGPMNQGRVRRQTVRRVDTTTGRRFGVSG